MDERSLTNADWVQRIEEMRRAWDAIVASVETAAIDRPGAFGDWSFKDVASHLNGWRELTVVRLEAAARGTEPPAFPWPDGLSEETPEEVDQINRWFFERDRARPAAELLEEARDQLLRMKIAVEALPEGTLQTRFPWLDGHPLSAVLEGALEHFQQDHEPEIRAWLAERTS